MIQFLAKLAFAGWAVFVAIMSLLPSEKAFDTGFSDKIEHICAYLALSYLLCMGWSRPKWAFFWAMSYGIAIELAQGAVGYRYPDLMDVFANGTGILVGIGLFLACQPLTRKLGFTGAQK